MVETFFSYGMEKQIWIIGHSNMPLEAFLELLHTYGIQTLADVR